MNSNQNKIASIILAAGMGKRMNNPEIPKVLCQLNGKPLIEYVLNTVSKLNSKKNVVIVGHKKEKLYDYLKKFNGTVFTCEQNEQLGTGHAVAQAESLFTDYKGDVLILAGDVPLISVETLNKFAEQHYRASADISVLSTIAAEPTGYGRIIRDSEGLFRKIVEEKDAKPQEKSITEINSGIYLIKSKLLFTSLKFVSNSNEQGEYYLTDIIEILRLNGAIVRAFALAEFDELQGVNSPADLLRAEKYLLSTKNEN